MSEVIYHQLAESIGVGDSEIVPEVFKMLTDEEEAHVVMAAAPPASVDEISEKTGIPSEKVEKMIDPLFKKGLIFKSSSPDPKRYYRARSLLQFHDATILWRDAPQEFLDLWKKYNETEFKEHHKRIEAALPRSVVRVIPVNIVLEPDAQVAAFEDVKQIVEKADSLAVTDCTCRVIDGACGKPLEVCIQVNKAANYSIERGTGRKLSKEEALEMLRMCEEEGLVHTVGNSRALGHIICNCCSDCCINWPGPRTSPVNFTAPSRFTAVVEEDLCNGCEICLERCYFEAITIEDDLAVINEDNCMGCGLCTVTCAPEAMNLKEIRNEDFVQ